MRSPCIKEELQPNSGCLWLFIAYLTCTVRKDEDSILFSLGEREVTADKMGLCCWEGL